MKDIIYLVYRTTNLISGMIYVGVHKQRGKEFDGYLGSGKWFRRSVKSIGKIHFRRETLFSYTNEKLAYSMERNIVNLDFIKSKNTYNLKLGGLGGWNLCWSPEVRDRQMATMIMKYGSQMAPCHTKEAWIKNKKSKIDRYGSIVGMIHTKEVREKAQISRKLTAEREGLCLGHYLNTQEAAINRRIKRDITAISKDQRLKSSIILTDVSNNKTEVLRCLDVCKILYTSRYAVKYRSKVYDALDNDRNLKINGKEYIVKESSTTSA